MEVTFSSTNSTDSNVLKELKHKIRWVLSEMKAIMSPPHMSLDGNNWFLT